MTGKVVGALLLIAAIAVFLTIREEGADKAFGGAFAPVQSVRSDDPARDSLAGFATGNPIPSPSQSNYGQLTDRVRERVGSAMRQGEKRSSRY